MDNQKNGVRKKGAGPDAEILEINGGGEMITNPLPPAAVFAGVPSILTAGPKPKTPIGYGIQA